MNVLLYPFHDADRVLQFFFRDTYLQLADYLLNQGLGPFPGLLADLREVYIADAHVLRANHPVHQALLFHVLYQAGQRGLGPVGDKGELVLYATVFVMQVL